MILHDFQRFPRFLTSSWENVGNPFPRASLCGELSDLMTRHAVRYIKMNSNFDIVTQTQVGEWEKFQVVLVEHPLKQFIGQTIGLYNIDWFRFLRMRGSGAGEVDGSPESRTREVMPKDWYDCKFTVVDAGNNKAQPPMDPHGSPSMAMDPHPWPCRCSWGMGSTRSCHHESSLVLMIVWMVMICYDFLFALVEMNEVDDFLKMFEVVMISCECW